MDPKLRKVKTNANWKPGTCFWSFDNISWKLIVGLRIIADALNDNSGRAACSLQFGDDIRKPEKMAR
jgi:hypothetical protein